MATYIKEKHELIDLATYGSKARKEMHPKVLVGGGGEQRYKQGDILDANATHNLIMDLIYGSDETDNSQNGTSQEANALTGDEQLVVIKDGKRRVFTINDVVGHIDVAFIDALDKYIDAKINASK